MARSEWSALQHSQKVAEGLGIEGGHLPGDAQFKGRMV
jgi:hypothetical protein